MRFLIRFFDFWQWLHFWSTVYRVWPVWPSTVSSYYQRNTCIKIICLHSIGWMSLLRLRNVQTLYSFFLFNPIYYRNDLRVLMNMYAYACTGFWIRNCCSVLHASKFRSITFGQFWRYEYTLHFGGFWRMCAYMWSAILHTPKRTSFVIPGVLSHCAQTSTDGPL